MAGTVATRLEQLGLTLPPQHPPAGTYVGYVTTGGLVHVAGVGPTWGPDVRYAGKVGSTLSTADGYAAARLTALNLLAHMQTACGGDLDRIVRCVKVFALVNAGPDYTDAHRVADGATDLIGALFGTGNLPARAITTAPSLPFNIAFEADAVFLIN
ncbi:RidA family protein [Ferrovibrio xuzhouensis]|uniref:RidA family protein n=1 Tax=Ferrovibrio xuzhouensis TaxID=1576914 RepID=A0ABV7VL00_9PROT